MKKIIFALLILLIPLNVFAYSNKIIPGGKTIGIEVNNDGVIVVGFYKIDNKFNRNGLKVGDTIMKVNDEDVSSIENLVSLIEKNIKNKEVLLTIKRDKKLFTKNFILVSDGKSFKTGLYVKDGVTGIGTLSYIDPETKIYGALGHEILESSSGNLIEVKTGSIFRSSITSIDRSTNGEAGTKNAKFYSNTIYGNVIKNTNKGIYGKYTGDTSKMSTLEVGTINDISLGKASIYTVLKDETIEEFEINIDNINNNETKNIHFTITSDDLINKTGGVVQGMSGSPIIQNDKIIGAVTHVIVDNPSIGYGILITSMLKEGEN